MKEDGTVVNPIVLKLATDRERFFIVPEAGTVPAFHPKVRMTPAFSGGCPNFALVLLTVQISISDVQEGDLESAPNSDLNIFLRKSLQTCYHIMKSYERMET